MAKRKKTRPSPIPYLLLAVGLAMVALWGVHRFLYNQSLSLPDALLAAYRPKTSQSALPSHITIGDKISLPVVEGGKVNTVWTVSPTGANHVLSSALPGEAGNIIIYGHNINSVFGYLVDSQVGERVAILTSDGKLHEYKITKTYIVPPSQTYLLAPTTVEMLTLYTCTGFLDSMRFVARAVPVL